MRYQLSTLTVLILGASASAQNLVVNPDFEAGNTGFFTQYTFDNSDGGGVPEGNYGVRSHPETWNPIGQFSACVDHTTGSSTGLMMLCNGATDPTVNIVWSQTIPVAQNTAYTFSFWAQSINFANPADMDVYAENDLLGSLQLTSTTCDWTQFSGGWNSGALTSVTLAILDANGIAGGNDFALDDMYFGKASIGTSYCVSNPNSTGFEALISATGSNSVSANNLVLSASPVPNFPGIFFYGPNQIQVPFGNGFRCVGGSICRLPISFGSGNALTRPVDITSPMQPSCQILAGSTWNFQAWFRDPPAGGALFNLSDGLNISFQL